MLSSAAGGVEDTSPVAAAFDVVIAVAELFPPHDAAAADTTRTSATTTEDLPRWCTFRAVVSALAVGELVELERFIRPPFLVTFSTCTCLRSYADDAQHIIGTWINHLLAQTHKRAAEQVPFISNLMQQSDLILSASGLDRPDVEQLTVISTTGDTV